jgi:hypothetical protein
MAALAWIKRVKLRFKLGDEKDSVGSVWALRRDDC